MQLDIQSLYFKKENCELEYKEGFSKNDVASTIAAMSTTKGGIILIGVKNDGTPIGIPTPANFKSELYDIARNTDGDRTSIEVEVIPHGDGKYIVVVKVFEGYKKPYGWRGIYYERVDDADEKLSPRRIAEIQLKYMNLTFDGIEGRIFGRDANIGDVDDNRLKDYAKGVSEGKRKRSIDFVNVKQTLQNLNLMSTDGNRVKNAALLMFGKDIQKSFPQAKINFLMYSNDEIKETDLILKKSIEGSLLEQFNKVTELISAYTENRVIMEGFRRTEINQYPSSAIREALVNALAHRDYTITESDILFRLFRNRLEIINPGGLLEGVKLDTLMRGGYPSYRRNPIVCRLFDDIGLMEESGQGIKNMIAAMKQIGLNSPRITIEDNNFKIEFEGQHISSVYRDKPLIGESKDISPMLTEKQRQGLGHINTLQEPITIALYMKAVGIKSRITAKSHLSEFVKLGILKEHKIGRELSYIKG